MRTTEAPTAILHARVLGWVGPLIGIETGRVGEWITNPLLSNYVMSLALVDSSREPGQGPYKTVNCQEDVHPSCTFAVVRVGF